MSHFDTTTSSTGSRRVYTDGGAVTTPACVTYEIGDAVDVLSDMEAESTAAIVLDDAWARPLRNGHFGTDKYETHDFPETVEIIEACRRVLEPGGYLLCDTDDWLLPKLCDYFREEWGDAPAGDTGGFQGIGNVTLLTKDGEPDRSTAGMYGSTGGYSVVVATKGDPRECSTSMFQTAERQREQYGWASAKPVAPYRQWIEGICEDGDRVVTPAAGTAPAAIAVEQVNIDLTCVAIDLEAQAKEAYLRRREDETVQMGLGAYK